MDNVRTAFLRETTYFKNVQEIEDKIYEDGDDDDNGAADPGNPIWDGSEVHDTWRGTDTTVPDANEVNQD